MKFTLPVVRERCTGHCCASFPLRGVGDGFVAHGDLEALKTCGDPDGGKIADMVFPLRVDAGIPLWGCRHFDGTSCDDYDNRPEMCRQHGIDGPCDVEGCTLVVS